MRDLKTIGEPFDRQPRHFYSEQFDAIAEYDACFTTPSPIDGALLAIVCSTGHGWDHVSVSRRNRPPNWAEMEYVKRRLFKDDEVAMQLHVPPQDHINIHPNVLHLWRPQTFEIPLPPKVLV